ncbi:MULTISPECIES: hypothetical protein [unclassified Lysobacter]|uniref:hypothetical protein n=1 Tax=unclassified Lysobacter TaxID=2635362 RepID=UPI0006FEF81B|nr:MULTISPECIES: hypothetical protein [unclassified Lysobacter]KRA14571.1 hypothetical protein ASD69_19695 [Lysobacter sp. Root604]KRD34308.1 hypothetical protein ASE35_11385 [Lysobacter sp. Root916]KRD72731.1 hypothetical protein ASE43_19100 [Lysobacter sp. Root983]SFK38410.1 hypothetical protein SAMN04487938_0559 [Lysobacter sp. cf310]
MYLLGLALSVIGGLWIIVNAFRESVLWGLGSLLIPLVALVFAIMNFSENKIPLLICVVGTVLTIMGMPSMSEIAATAQPAA